MPDIECLLCYEAFGVRDDKPSLRVCKNCAPTLGKLDTTCCPNCGWPSEKHRDCGEPENLAEMMQIKNRRPDWEYGWCGGEHWGEVWTCPECGTIWEFDNGSV